MYDDRFAEGLLLGQNRSNDGMFGGEGGWAWWIIILLIFGWGGNGFGGNNGGGSMVGYELGKVASTSDVASGFTNSEILSSLDDIQLQATNNLNFINQGFAGLNTSIITNGYETRDAVRGVANQLASCCCDVERAIDGVNYNMAQNTCNIIRAGQDNTQRIIDFLTNDKISELQADKVALQNQISQANQTAQILSTLRPIPQPAYLAQSPFQSLFGFNNGCGCGFGTL